MNFTLILKGVFFLSFVLTIFPMQTFADSDGKPDECRDCDPALPAVGHNMVAPLEKASKGPEELASEFYDLKSKLKANAIVLLNAMKDALTESVNKKTFPGDFENMAFGIGTYGTAHSELEGKKMNFFNL